MFQLVWPSFLILFILPYSYSQWINSPSLDCSRIPTTLCCTSRIREQCATQCRNVDCGSNHFNSLFSTDFTAGGTAVSARDDSAHVNGNNNNRESFVENPDSVAVPSQGFVPKPQTSNTGFAPELPQPPPAPTAAPQAFTTQIPSNLNPVFPTLIPFEPSIDESTANLSKDNEASWTTVKPAVTEAHRHRTPDPRIIRPPAELVMIDEYDIVDKMEPELRESPIVSNTGWVNGASSKDNRLPSNNFDGSRHDGNTAPFHSSSARSIDNNGAANRKLTCQLINGRPICYPKETADQGTDFIKNILTKYRRKIKQFTPEFTRSEKRPTWSVSLLRRADGGRDPDSTIAKIPNFAVDGQAGNTETRGQSALHRGIDALIGSLSSSGANIRERSKGTEFQGTAQPGFGALEVMGSGSVLRTTTAHPLPITLPARVPAFISTALPMLPFRQQPAPVFPQCGVAPEYKPCVSSLIASRDLISCCQRKNLPPGCLQLCRYDITQAEVRAAMDRGQCSLLNVAPFLECASQGHDNTQCCQTKGVQAKTGPQCLQFCRSGMGLTPLGLQHIVCGNAIGEMLQCHHSGIRPKLF